MRIAVFSDTHLADTVDARAFLLGLLTNVLDPVDMILHAGDLIDPGLLDVFDGYTVHAVRGNMDPSSSQIPIKKIIDVKGFRIGLIHGWGAVKGLEERIYRKFSPLPLDCLVYGHSHIPVCHERHGMLFFNPGSATDRRSMSCHTVGLLEIDKSIKGTIIRLD